MREKIYTLSLNVLCSEPQRVMLNNIALQEHSLTHFSKGLTPSHVFEFCPGEIKSTCKYLRRVRSANWLLSRSVSISDAASSLPSSISDFDIAVSYSDTPDRFRC